jgi:hypothetical protein
MPLRFPRLVPLSVTAALLAMFAGACSSRFADGDRIEPYGGSAVAAERPATPIRWRGQAECLAGHATAWGQNRQEIADLCAAQEAARGTAGSRDFVAVAISGGGAKAATFGGEALFMLQRFGLLQQVDVLSGVSGGSFAAALYALSCDPGDQTCEAGTAAGQRRPNWQYEEIMRRLSQGYMPLIAEGLARAFAPVPFLSAAIPNQRFAQYIDEAYLSDQGGAGRSFTFADLNPRRPHLFLNAAIVSGERFVLDTDVRCLPGAQRRARGGAAGREPPGYLRRRDDDEAQHISFTDFYFRRLCRDIRQFPVARAVAASGAFPVLVDFARVRDGAPRSGEQNDGRPRELLLTDGGANDNQGLIEVYLTLAEALGGQRRSDAAHLGLPQGRQVEAFERRDRGLVLVINTSLTSATGVDGEPAFRANAPLLGFVLGGARRASAAFDRASAANYSARSRLYLRELALAGAAFERPGREGGRGWTGWLEEERLRIAEIGLTVLDDYALGGTAFQRRERNIWEPREVPAALGLDPIHDPDRRRLELQVERQGRAFDVMRDPQTRRRLGLGDTHPQCVYERAKEADAGLLALASLPGDVAGCLRLAARWSVALRAQELCDMLGGPKPPLNEPGAFAAACRDGRLDFLPLGNDEAARQLGMVLDGAAPGHRVLQSLTCPIDTSSPDIRAVLAEARERAGRHTRLADRLPTSANGEPQCRIRDRSDASLSAAGRR